MAHYVELETSRVCKRERVTLLRNVVQKDRVMTVILGTLHGHLTHRRLEVLGDSKAVLNWMNGSWEVKGDEHAVPVRGVVDQFVRWYFGWYISAESG